VAEIVVEFSWSEYEIDDNLSRLRGYPHLGKQNARKIMQDTSI